MSIRRIVGGAFVLGLFAMSHAAQAQTATGIANMTGMWNSWNEHALAVKLDVPEVSAGCTTPGVYVTDPSSPASKLIEPILISAYMARRRIELALQGCYQNTYPRIISVWVEP